MKNVKIIASLLYYLSRTISILYFFTAAYALFVFILVSFHPTSLLDTTEPGKFVIMYPFTSSPFLLGDHDNIYMGSMICFLLGYGTFAWLISDVFKVYLQPLLFTAKAVRKLKVFYLFNFIAPFLFLTGAVLFGGEIRDIVMISILHFIIGIFVFFMAAIFQQGVSLQTEQDLTI